MTIYVVKPRPTWEKNSSVSAVRRMSSASVDDAALVRGANDRTIGRELGLIAGATGKTVGVDVEGTLAVAFDPAPLTAIGGMLLALLAVA